MTDLFEASLALAGRKLERAAARDGSRGVGIAHRVDGGSRELVTVVGPEVAEGALAEHAGWDLPLVDVRPIETSSGPRTLVAEALPSGVPSSWIEQDGGGHGLLAVARELAMRVAAEHSAGRTVGPLHAATVLVDPDTLTIAAVAQRPLRIAGAIAVEGDRPLLGYGTWAPRDLLGGPATPADDVFRLAILAWRWRHGEHPFGALTDAGVLAQLSAIGAGDPAPLQSPGDELDRVLLGCLAPSPAARPTATELVAALGVDARR